MHRVLWVMALSICTVAQVSSETPDPEQRLSQLIADQHFYGLPPDCLALQRVDAKNNGYTIDVYSKQCPQIKKAFLLGKWRISATDGAVYAQNRDGKYKSPLIVPKTAKITEHQAMDIVNSIPEMKIWADYITKTSKGLSISALRSEACCYQHNSGAYWEVKFYEHAKEGEDHTWEHFLVREDGGEVLIQSVLEDEIITLSDWRRQGKSLRSIGVE